MATTAQITGFDPHVTVLCDNKRLLVGHMRQVNATKHVIILLDRSRKTRRVSMSRVTRGMAMGKMPARWPPTQAYDHLHYVAICTSSGTIVGQYHQDSDQPNGSSQIGSDTKLHMSQSRWSTAVSDFAANNT
jgi:hypothetical protein